ncbi:MAG: glycosyltransferase family 4 protein [Planctomycetales bacterium]|nr:glycosyltransferase family 4 protein [Planctomycetales bacterium]MCB9253161.1 glycosyltransferase family 4 protein [Pseudobdellovibrionaceae bacterium]
MVSKLFIFDTHPIQYRSPVFRALAAKVPGLKVFFFSENFDGRKWWFNEVGKIPSQNWNLELKEGFANEVLESRRGLFRFTRKVMGLLWKERPSAVLIYGWYLPEHWILWALCRVRGIPLIFVGETFSHGASRWRVRLKRVLHPLFFSGVRQFISIGKKTYDFYRSFNIARSQITEARYCVDTTFFSLPPDKSIGARVEKRTELGIPQNAFVLLFVGRLFERKRPWDLFSLYRRLKQHQNLHLVIVGNGPLEKDLLELRGPGERIHFAGFRDQAETRAMYHASDLLVVPSEFETWGLVINEAFASGLPALVTDTCGAANDLVIPGKTGFVYPVGNMEIAAALISPYIERPALAERLGENARERVVREYNVGQFAKAIEQALQTTTSY